MNFDFTVELSDCGHVFAHQTPDGKIKTGLADDLLDCCASGNVEAAISQLIDVYNISYRITKKIRNQYVNTDADASDKQRICELIYTESDTDFSDETTAEKYLIWEAAANFKNYLLEGEK